MNDLPGTLPMMKAPACPLGAFHWTQPGAQAADLEYFSTHRIFDYLRGDCGAFFIQPVPVKELSRIYPPH